MEQQDLPLKTQPNAFDQLMQKYIPVTSSQWVTPAELAKSLSESPAGFASTGVVQWLKENQTVIIAGAAILFTLAMLRRGR